MRAASHRTARPIRGNVGPRGYVPRCSTLSAMNDPLLRGHGGVSMTLAPRRALACVLRLLVLLLLLSIHRAEAQTVPPSRRVVVLIVLPSAARLDAPRLRAEIGDELGADART